MRRPFFSASPGLTVRETYNPNVPEYKGPKEKPRRAAELLMRNGLGLLFLSFIIITFPAKVLSGCAVQFYLPRGDI